jgi:N-carbamoylputrescine amidase
MRAALIVNPVGTDEDENLQAVRGAVSSAAAAGANLVVLPETAITGLVNNGDPAHDLPLGKAIPGPLTDELAKLAQRCGLHLAIGLFERTGNALYDSAVLLSPQGHMLLHYRRIQPQWHGPRVDPAVYRQGSRVPAADTPLGRFAIILCGDLFDDDVVSRVCVARPDWLLLPLARCFGEGSYDQERWDRDELPLYLERLRAVGCPTLMVNYFSEPDCNAYFGGALVVSALGEVMASWPLGQAGTLLVDLRARGG